MEPLLFHNFTFNGDLNLTVRRGTKWDERIGLRVLSSSSGDHYRGAIITMTRVMPFKDLKDDDLVLEHDPACRSYDGLLKFMKEVYDDFKEDEIVTLVYFKLINTED